MVASGSRQHKMAPHELLPISLLPLLQKFPMGYFIISLIIGNTAGFRLHTRLCLQEWGETQSTLIDSSPLTLSTGVFKKIILARVPKQVSDWNTRNFDWEILGVIPELVLMLTVNYRTKLNLGDRSNPNGDLTSYSTMSAKRSRKKEREKRKNKKKEQKKERKKER